MGMKNPLGTAGSKDSYFGIISVFCYYFSILGWELGIHLFWDGRELPWEGKTTLGA